jgi:hypothetical protein
MGKRGRRRERTGASAGTAPLPAPVAEYVTGDGDTLVLRCVLTPKTRTQYAQVLHGNVLSQEDAWHRAVEFLFERLAVSWTIAGVTTAGQRDLLLRLRAATPDERAGVRAALREHCAEWFPDVEAP